MLLPGSQGWINKYFALVKLGRIEINTFCPPEYDDTHYLHLLSGQTGLIFGYCTQFIFFNGTEREKWTDDEKLKIVLFETMLWIYLQKNTIKVNSNSIYAIKESFILSLRQFYALNFSHEYSHIFSETKTTIRQIENVLDKRISTSQRLFDNQWWLKTMSNVFVYLDVICYQEFITQMDCDTAKIPINYSDYAYNVLVAVRQVLNISSVENEHKRVFMSLLSLSNLASIDYEKITSIIDRPSSFNDFSSSIHNDALLRRFALDLAVFIAYGNIKDEQGLDYFSFKRLAQFLKLNKIDFEESVAMVENMMLHQGSKKMFWFNKNIYQKVQDNFSLRWKKIIMRNKDKLLTELSQSKELVMLIKKSTVQELTDEEKEKVRVQFIDIVRTIPMLAIFMLPGGAILLPFILKLLPALLPSAFRDNQVDE